MLEQLVIFGILLAAGLAALLWKELPDFLLELKYHGTGLEKQLKPSRFTRAVAKVAGVLLVGSAVFGIVLCVIELTMDA